MIKKLKKHSLIVLTMLIFIAFNSLKVLAADDSILSLGTRTITDVNKTWTITFSDAVDFTSIPNNIQIKDITTGKFLSANPIQGENNCIIKVKAPSEGYTVGHNYQISINKNIKFTTSKFLTKTTVVNFLVDPKGSNNSSNDSKNYTISANVTVSPTIDIFKQITITSTNLPGAAKYKVEGNKNLFDIGKPMAGIVSGNTVKVYVFDSLGNTIGTANMDVSTTRENMNLNLQYKN